MMITGLLLVFSFMVILIGRCCYLIFIERGSPVKKDKSRKFKTLIILGSGGHTTEMLRIVKNLDFNKYFPRIYIHAQSDKMSASKIREVEGKIEDYKIVSIFRSREVGQSYSSSVATTLIALIHSITFLWSENPDLILCNGPGTGVPLCLGAFFFRVFFLSKTRLIFIESFCRVKSFSLTGKILYYFADDIIVQWPELCNEKSKHVHFVK